MDEESWRRFIAFCKLKNVKAGDELKKILDDYLAKNLGDFLYKKEQKRAVKK